MVFSEDQTKGEGAKRKSTDQSVDEYNDDGEGERVHKRQRISSLSSSSSSSLSSSSSSSIAGGGGVFNPHRTGSIHSPGTMSLEPQHYRK